MSFDRWELQVLTTKLDMCQITLREAKLHALRLGYFVKGKSKERFLRELAGAIETKEERTNEGNRTWSCTTTTGEWSSASLSSSGSAS